jgi:predicted secreted protein
MSWISASAIFFIIWWTVLFAALPFGLRTQDEDGNVAPGTVASAPRGKHMRWAFLRTTIISAILFGIFLVVTRVYHLGIDDIPRIVPNF